MEFQGLQKQDRITSTEKMLKKYSVSQMSSRCLLHPLKIIFRHFFLIFDEKDRCLARMMER